MVILFTIFQALIFSLHNYSQNSSNSISILSDIMTDPFKETNQQSQNKSNDSSEEENDSFEDSFVLFKKSNSLLLTFSKSNLSIFYHMLYKNPFEEKWLMPPIV